MNKKSNLTRTALLGALLCGIAGPTFVGCKDYDDDINGLQEQVNTLNKGLEDLKKLVESGKSITDVVAIEGGFKITFNDGTSYEIVSKEGTPGTPGANGSIVTVDENGHLWIDNEDKGKVVNDEVAPADVAITIDADGYICVNGEKQEGAKIDMSAGNSYAVVKEDLIEFYLPDDKGQMPETPIKIWKNAALAGLMTMPMHLYDVNENGLLFPTIYGVDKDGNYVRLYAGKADVKYEINPKSADVKVNGFTTQQIVSRAAKTGILFSDEKVEKGYLTLRAKAMSGLFSYNKLENVDPDSYVYRYDESKLDGDKGIIDPLANIVALSVTSQQNENLISDYVMAFDYNISVDDVTIEKKVVKEGEVSYENSLYTTEKAAQDGDPNFTLVYADAKGSLNLTNEIAAFFTREGRTGVVGKFEMTANGFDEHSYVFEKMKFEFTDGTNKEDHGSYVNLAEDGTLTIVEAEDEKGSSIGRTPIVKITLKSDEEVNHGQEVKTVYAKVIISEKEIDPSIPAYEGSVDYMLNNVGDAQYLQMDKLYGYVAEHLGILGADKFYATYPKFKQILDEAPEYDNEIQLALTAQTGTDKQEWLAVYVPNYKQAGVYKVKGVFESENANVYPPVYVVYTVNVVYPVGPYLTKRENAGEGGNFWENGMMIVNGVFEASNDYVFKMGGKMADAFVYNLPYDENPWNAEWSGNETDKIGARANIQYTFLNPNEKNATIGDMTTSVKENWLGEIAISQIEENADYRDIEVQPITWFNLDLKKMVNKTALEPETLISMTDGLSSKTEGKFTVRFVSPLKALTAQGGELDKNNTTMDQTFDVLKSVIVKDKKDVVLYKEKAFQQITVANGVQKDAGAVYQIAAPKFTWADENSKNFALDMEKRGGKCTLDETTGVITFHATGEVGAVDLKVKVTMDCPWRKLETVVTVSVK